MNRLYQKSEIGFAILWIIIYIIGASTADWLSSLVDINQVFTLLFLIILSMVFIIWIRKNNLSQKFGLCPLEVSPKKFLYYIPLAILVSTNFWLGVNLNISIINSLVSALTMLSVGFVEELIFRGFLFKAMEKDNLKTAIIVSSLTFGIGHIINLFTGQASNLLSNIFQVFYAMAVGFLFVVIFWRGKSLWPCIITHSLVNASSIFMNNALITPLTETIISLVIIAIAVVYSLIILKTTKTTPPPVSHEQNS